jgi:hypothetical protein
MTNQFDASCQAIADGIDRRDNIIRELSDELADLVDWLHDNQRSIEGEFSMDDLLAGPRAVLARAEKASA